MGLAEDSSSIDGRVFPSNYIYAVTTNLFNEGTADGHPTYFGSVGHFTATSLSGLVTVTNAQDGIFTLAGQTYHLMGSDPTGQYLIFGTGASGGQPAFAISNSGSPSAIDVRFSSANPYMTPPVACFVEGTAIRTARGEVPVEALVVGDRVDTVDGRRLAVTWLGHRTLRPGASPWGADLRPVEIAAGAFGDGMPVRALRLSPGHSVAVTLLDTTLIPVSALVNGCTIRRVDVERVTYWHVELEEHAVLHAEGLACESYLDMGQREQFADDGAVTALPVCLEADGTAATHPAVVAGPLVTALRQQLAGRAERLGWRSVEGAAELTLEVDGMIVRAEISGSRLRFAVPPHPRAVRLLCSTHVPADSDPASDDFRPLGAMLTSLAICDGFAPPRAIALDSALLGTGFHPVEDGYRWIGGCAAIDPAAWRTVEHGSYLTVEAVRIGGPGWRWSAEAAAGARDAA